MEKNFLFKSSKNVRTLKFSFKPFDNKIIVNNLVSNEKVILLSKKVLGNHFLLITELDGIKRVFYGSRDMLFEYGLIIYSKTETNRIEILFEINKDETIAYQDFAEDIFYGDKYYTPELSHMPNESSYNMVRLISPWEK